MIELPQDFLTRMRSDLGGRYDEFLNQYNAPHVKGIRINTLKFDLIRADEIGLSLEKIPFSPFGFKVHNERSLGNNPFHHAGAFYSQEPSAMAAVTALDPQKGDKVLDMCAAPGGKSTQIAQCLDGEGLLWSNEIVRNRAQILLSNVERLGVRNAVVSSVHPDVLAEKLTGFFDKVLVDAPCSGEGMFRRDEIAVREWSVEHTRTCAVRQLAILESAKKCLKENGVLVYSTCTFSPVENEGVINSFLDDNPDFSLEEINVDFGEKSEIGIRIYPSDIGEGHFVAKLRRDSENPCVCPQIEKNDKKCEIFDDCFNCEQYGILNQIGENIYLFPEKMPDVRDLQILRAGVLAGKAKKNRIEPEHALFMASHSNECRRIVNLSPDDERIFDFLHGEEIEAETDSGWTAVAVGGVVTGFGKVSNGVLKNKYPKGLRILR